MNKFVLRQSLILFLTALIWGVAFVAQSAGMDYIEPFTMNAVRCLLGGIVLLPVIAAKKYLTTKKSTASDKKEEEQISKRDGKSVYIGGICCGILLCIASNFQQFGIKYTTVGKAGFITALYIVIVPILGVFFQKRLDLKIGIAVLLAVIGLYLLCMKEGLSLSMGDSLVLICAFVFSVHILVIDFFSPKVDGVKMSCIQFFTCSVLSGICMFLFESPQISQILAAWLPIGYAGIMSCGVAYTLQIVGQKGMNPTVASLILSLESVTAAVAGFFLLGQKMLPRELAGCIIMFIAIILAQLPSRQKSAIVKEN